MLALSFSGFRNLLARQDLAGSEGKRFALEAMPALLMPHAPFLRPCWPGFRRSVVVGDLNVRRLSVRSSLHESMPPFFLSLMRTL